VGTWAGEGGAGRGRDLGSGWLAQGMIRKGWERYDTTRSRYILASSKLPQTPVYTDAGLGGISPVFHATVALPSTYSIVPPFANTSFQTIHALSHALPLTFKLWT
jgi:hypothetical protein